MPTPMELFKQSIEGTVPHPFVQVKAVYGGFVIEAVTRYVEPITGNVVREVIGNAATAYDPDWDESQRNQGIAEVQQRVGNWLQYGAFEKPAE